MNDLRPHHFKQNCKKCCSAQSVATIYNYVNNRSFSDKELLFLYPEWEKLIGHPEGVGIDNLATFVSDLFDTDVEVYHRPLKMKNLVHCIQYGFVIIYYNRHYSPILHYDGYYVWIGQNGTHGITKIPLGCIIHFIDSYLSF